MPGWPWPEEAALAPLGRLLCRPSPLLVAATAIDAAGDLAALAAQLAPRVDPLRQRELETAMQAWGEAGGGLVHCYDAAYPPLLRHTARPPLALFLRGDAAALLRPSVAIVGSRAASAAARDFAHELAFDLARLGIGIASGLARGIDAAAHEGALDSGGTTIAVQGCGPDLVYPPYHAALADRIAARGCIATEFPPGTLPRTWHFPMRNRILAGLASGVVVVQAEEKSGALTTARHARDGNREVMAVPGDVRDPRSRGPHALLRDGAALVDGAAAVLEALGYSGSLFVPGLRAAGSDGEEKRAEAGATASTPGIESDGGTLLEALAVAQPIDVLHARLGWTPARLQRALAALEIAGLVAREPGGVLRRERC